MNPNFSHRGLRHDDYFSKSWSALSYVLGLVITRVVPLLVFIQQFNILGQEFDVEGTSRNRVFMSDGKTFEAPTLNFTLSIRGCKWIARFTHQFTTNAQYAPDWEEASSDGTNIYYLQNTSSAIATARAGGKVLTGQNIATARTFNKEVFNLQIASDIGPIWLTYGSACYLALRNDSFIEPVMARDFFGGIYAADMGPKSLSLKMRAKWSLATDEPHLPVELIYYADRTIASPKGPVPRTGSDAQRINGLKGAEFRAGNFTNINGLEIPMWSSLKVYAFKTTTTTTPAVLLDDELEVRNQYDVVLTHAMANSAPIRTSPTIPGNTYIEDQRFNSQSYSVTNAWPSVADLKTNKFFIDLRKSQAERARQTDRPNAKLTVILFSFVILVTVLLLLQRRKAE